MKLWLEGIGVWGPGITSWPEFLARLADHSSLPEYREPPAEALSRQQRRRSTASVRLAVEVASQACAAAGRAPEQYATVSASSAGDLATVDAMCKTLAADARLLSPTRFHNSVYNAPGGYWSIVSDCQQPANAVAAGDDSFAAGLLEAAIQATVEASPVLLLAYDLPGTGPLAKAVRITTGFGVGLALVSTPRAGAPELDIRHENTAAVEPGMHNGELDALRRATPSARSLPLLAAVAEGGHAALRMGAGRLVVSVATRHRAAAPSNADCG
jgi:hypothetical protein